MNATGVFKPTLLLTVACVVILLGMACVGDGTGLDENGNPLGAGESGTVESVTFSADVQPIFTLNCALSGCHAGSAPAMGQNLSEGMAYANIVGVPSREVPALNRIEPDEPDRSYLIHKIQGTQSSVGGFGGRMPLGGGALADDEIATIRAWVARGALNN